MRDIQSKSILSKPGRWKAAGKSDIGVISNKNEKANREQMGREVLKWEGRGREVESGVVGNRDNGVKHKLHSDSP